MDGRKMLKIMNNLESTTELNAILQKNIEWQKSNSDTLRIKLRKREEQLMSSNIQIQKLESKVSKWQTISLILGVVSALLLLTN
jgi:hypothetical protein